VYLAIAVAMRKALWARRERGGRLTRWASGTSLRTAALIVIVASSGIYYAAFAIMFVLVAMVASRLARSDKNFTVFNGGAVLVGIGLVLVFNLLPTVLYHRIHGSNPMTGQRSASESLTYGLNLIGEVLPPPWHRLHAFRALSDKYWHDTGLPSEGSAWGGTISTLGLLLLAASLMATLVGATASRWLVDARLRAAALIALTGVLLGATGAGGAFISYVINPSLRAWNRISIVLVFCSLLAVAMALDALWRRAQARGRRASIAFVAVIPAVIAFGAWDQTSPMATKPDYAQARQQWSTDAHFVQAISASLGGHGEVYQIPYLPFPESPPIFNMGDYSPMRGYLHAGKGIKWSYGAMKGRPGDWQQEASALPLDEQIPAVALAGFDGLWVDTAGYTNADTQAVTPLRTITGRQPIMSADARFAYFDLRPLRTSLQKRLPGPEVKTVGPELLHPLQSTYGDGFYKLEQNPDTTWYWARSHASIKLDNPATRPRRVQFSAHLSSFARADVQVTLDGRPVATTVSTKLPGHPVKLTFTVPVGPHVLTLSTNAPATKFGNDARDLRLQVLAPQVADAAFADLAPPPARAKKQR
jgi:phosphoglycerol transferase